MINEIEKYFLLFIIYAIIGWIMEVTCKLIEKRKFINRGFLIGPYCPIYGYGALLITILLKKYTSDPVVLFVMGIVICSILEYLTSYFMEKLFHARWWDYSQKKFNINGRIYLGTMIPFGLLGLFMMYVSNPFFFSILDNMSGLLLNIISILIFIIFLIDNIISFNIISNVNITSKKIKDNTEEITEEVLDDITRRVKELLNKKSILHRRLMNAYPNMKMRIKSRIKKGKDKIKKLIV